jgi:putative Ca2+/H+ antiporter (TMEM165/GDT1 family)
MMGLAVGRAAPKLHRVTLGRAWYSERMKFYLVVFLSVLVAELGDKTQIATLLFAANPETSKLGVFLAAAAALILSSALAVVVGAHIGRWIAPDHLRIMAGLGFVAIGVWVLLT